jgi:hypothetical protein
MVYFPFAPVTGTASTGTNRSVLVVYADVLQAPPITV